LLRFGSVERLLGPRAATATRLGRLGWLGMSESSWIDRLVGFVLRLRDCIASTATVAECRRSGLSFRIRRSLDSHDSTLLRSSSDRVELRAQKISFHYSTIGNGSLIHINPTPHSDTIRAAATGIDVH
jgi:hypothetical protein